MKEATERRNDEALIRTVSSVDLLAREAITIIVVDGRALEMKTGAFTK